MILTILDIPSLNFNSSMTKKRKGHRHGDLFANYLRITHWNMGGVLSNTYGNKLDDSGFLKLIEGEDIIALTETHIGKDGLSIPGYVVRNQIRPKSKKAKRYSGGIALAIKHNLNDSVEIIKSKSDNILWARLKCSGKGKDLLLGTVYISPFNSTYSKNILSNQFKTWDILIEELAVFRSKYNVCLVGDFNARTGTLPDVIVHDDGKFVGMPDDYENDRELLCRNNCDDSINQFGERLCDMCRMCGLRIVNGRKLGDSTGKKTCHEWNGSSTVDYMLVDESLFQLVQTFKVHDVLDHLSDHCPISSVLNLCYCRNKDNDSVDSRSQLQAPKRLKWDIILENKFKMKLACKKMEERIHSIFSIPLKSNEDIENALAQVNDILTSAAEVRINRKVSKKKKCKKSKKLNKPWFTDELITLRKDLKKAGHDLVSNCRDDIFRQRFFKLKKKFKEEVKRKKREFKQGLYDRLVSLSKDNPKEYWDLFNELKNCHGDMNINSYDCPIKDEEWLKHYTNLLGPQKLDENRIKSIRNQIEDILHEPYFSELDYAISIEEIIKASTSLKNKKSAGLDNISNEMVKSSLPFMSEVFKKIFNVGLCNQYYPTCWKTGMIVNLFKSGEISNTDNYRGLTINSCLGKLFNTVMNNRLLCFLEKNKSICDNQIGFKKKARTGDHIFIINTIFRKFCNAKKKLYVCFVDFRKAYDKVWQEALLLKLLKMGVRGNFFGVIRSMYTDCRSCIKNDGFLSNTFPCLSGVRQGDVMSPNLFNIYINDLPSIFDNDNDSPKLNNVYVHCLLYADDLVLFSLTEDGLQDKLNKLYAYCKDWGLEINSKKTQVMAMSNSNAELPIRGMKIGDATLQWVRTYKYLGILVNSNGDFLSSSENLCARGWKAIFKIKTALKDINVDPELTLKLFDTLVKPVVCYNGEIWGVMNNVFNSKSISQFWERIGKLSVENFQIKFCKSVLGVRPRAHNGAVMGELGRLPLFLNIIKSTLKYIIHLNDVKNERPLLNAAIVEDGNLCVSKSWIKKVQKIVNFFQCNISKKLDCKYIDEIYNKMKTSYLVHWRKQLGDESCEEGKLYLYRRIKPHFRMEPYLKHVKNFKFRRALAAFRLSAHNLEIETGRYVYDRNLLGKKCSIQREDRFCCFCFNEFKCKVMGDEMHAILNCPQFNDVRQNFFSKIEILVPNFKELNDYNKLYYMLTCEGESVRLVSRFLAEVLSAQRLSFEKIWREVNNPNG